MKEFKMSFKNFTKDTHRSIDTKWFVMINIKNFEFIIFYDPLSLESLFV